MSIQNFVCSAFCPILWHSFILFNTFLQSVTQIKGQQILGSLDAEQNEHDIHTAANLSGKYYDENGSWNDCNCDEEEQEEQEATYNGQLLINLQF